jgi:hypothetical protein
MSDAQATAAARELARARWGNQVAVRSAETVIERVGELPAEIRAAVHEVTAPAAGDADGDG